MHLGWEVFALTMSNPLIIFMFLSLFSLFGESTSVAGIALWLTVGVFLGSFTWWVVLGCLLEKFGGKLSNDLLYKTRYFTSVFLLVCGLAFIGYSVKSMVV